MCLWWVCCTIGVGRGGGGEEKREYGRKWEGELEGGEGKVIGGTLHQKYFC